MEVNKESEVAIDAMEIVTLIKNEEFVFTPDQVYAITMGWAKIVEEDGRMCLCHSSTGPPTSESEVLKKADGIKADDGVEKALLHLFPCWREDAPKMYLLNALKLFAKRYRGSKGWWDFLEGYSPEKTEYRNSYPLDQFKLELISLDAKFKAMLLKAMGRVPGEKGLAVDKALESQKCPACGEPGAWTRGGSTSMSGHCWATETYRCPSGHEFFVNWNSADGVFYVERALRLDPRGRPEGL
jgi:hypothetical protein